MTTKYFLPFKSFGWALALVLSIAGVCTAQATPPDLTAPGVIADIDRSRTYNLGPTGLRGWVHQDWSGTWIGQMTDLSRQILVTTASTPGSAVLAVDDVILGAVAASSGTVPPFSSDARKAFGTAVTNAEKTGAGTLRVKRWRAGTITDVNIPIATLGTYSATAPYNCPKSALVLANARDQMVGKLLADASYFTSGNGHARAINALALLGSVVAGDPNFDRVQTRLQTYARSLTTPANDAWTWGAAYELIFLAEYYLLTSDPQVVPVINGSTVRFAKGQGMFGTFGHGMGVPHPDGSGRMIIPWYGPVNVAGNAANVSIVLGKKALAAASHPIDPEINAAIHRASGFMGSHVNKGAMQYGEHFPHAGSHATNSREPLAAVFFGLQDNKAVQTEYFARTATSSWIGLENGHAGQGWGTLWGALGAGMGGEAAASAHFKQLLWRYDIHRRTDGSFTFDSDTGGNDYYGGKTADGTYLGESLDSSVKGSSLYLLTYSLPLKRLYITGKDLNTAYDHNLDATKVDNAISAASFALDRTGLSIPQLFTALGEYDPHVRHFASLEIASRSLTSTDLTNLRDLLTDSNPNLRQSATQVLGYLQDSTALPALVALLRDPDHWVRQQAANALRYYANTAAVSAHRDAIIEAFIANGPSDPDAIDWSDPLQFSNGQLAQLLFGDTNPDGAKFPRYSMAASTANAPKATHLYPALRIGLQLPSGRYRSAAANFLKYYLSPTDAQALFQELVQVQSYIAPGDTMFGGGPRAEAMNFLAASKIKEGIPLALAMLEEGGGNEALAALASYGDAARYTLPTLRRFRNEWDIYDGNGHLKSDYVNLLNTITTIENAVTAPTTIPGLCVANSQVVATTGAKVITLTGASPRGALSFLNISQPAHGTLTGTAPNITYTPKAGYSGPDQFTFQTADSLANSEPATVSINVGSAGSGIVGEYFNNADFTNPVLSRTDPQINFDWGTGSPDSALGSDTFSVRWDGLLQVPETGTYIFSTLNSDGTRLNINGQMVIDNYVDQTPRWTDGTPVHLTAGEIVDLQMFYYDNTGPAVAKLKWTGPSFAGPNGAFIGSEWLYDGAGITRTPYAHAQSVTLLKDTTTPIQLTGSGGPVAYTVTTGPVHGALTGSAPDLTYTPNPGYSGTDSFTFRINNGTSDSAPATVFIKVQDGTLTSFTWARAVSGNWSTAASWTPGLPAADGLSSYALKLTSSGTYTATHDLKDGFQLNQLDTAGNLTLDGANSVSFVANGSSLPQFNHGGRDAVTINHPLSLQAMTTLGGTGSGSVILAGTISGSGGIIKNNPGNLQIGKNNSYSGGTIINGGMLTMEDRRSSALGTGPVTLNGGTLEALRIDARNPVIVNGGMLTADGGWGGSWSGPFTLNGDLTVHVPGYDRVSLNGILSGAGGLIADGESSRYGSGNGVFLTGVNTYTGKTTVKNGMLLNCTKVHSLGSGPVDISSGARLNLAYRGTKAIPSLTLDGTVMPAGTYGSATSPASNKNNTYFNGTGTVTVLANTPPVASSQRVSTAEDIALPITLSATDAEGHPLTYSIVSGPANGTLVGTPPNVAYAPFLNYIGPDRLTFNANDGSLDSAVATVDITVTKGSNDAPAAHTQSLSTPPNTSKAITLSGIDAEGDALTYVIVTQPGSGSLRGAAPDLIYSPATNHNGPDSFTFKVNDGTSDSPPATVSITVTSGIYQPGLWYGTVAGNINTTLANPKFLVTVDLSQTEDSISDNTTEIYTGEIHDADGRISFTEDIDDKTRLYIDGKLVLSSDTWSDRKSTRNLNLTPGWHMFELRISNGVGGSGPHTRPGFGYDANGGTSWTHPSDPGDASPFRCSIAGGTAPVANVQSVTTARNTAKTIALTGTDEEGSPLTYTIVTQPSSGTLSGMTPHVIYTPAANYSGSDNFTFTVNDGLLDSAVANVAITVTPGNDPTLTDYPVWAAKFAHANLTDPNADLDGDGLINNDERIWGLDPTKAASRNPFTSLSDLTGGTFRFTRRVPALTGLRYTVWTSTNLITWTQDPGAVQTPGTAVAEVETVSGKVSPALVTGLQLYIQMRAAQP